MKVYETKRLKNRRQSTSENTESQNRTTRFRAAGGHAIPLQMKESQGDVTDGRQTRQELAFQKKNATTVSPARLEASIEGLPGHSRNDPQVSSGLQRKDNEKLSNHEELEPKTGTMKDESLATKSHSLLSSLGTSLSPGSIQLKPKRKSNSGNAKDNNKKVSALLKPITVNDSGEMNNEIFTEMCKKIHGVRGLQENKEWIIETFNDILLKFKKKYKRIKISSGGDPVVLSSRYSLVHFSVDMNKYENSHFTFEAFNAIRLLQRKKPGPEKIYSMNKLYSREDDSLIEKKNNNRHAVHMSNIRNIIADKISGGLDNDLDIEKTAERVLLEELSSHAKDVKSAKGNKRTPIGSNGRVAHHETKKPDMENLKGVKNKYDAHWRNLIKDSSHKTTYDENMNRENNLGFIISKMKVQLLESLLPKKVEPAVKIMSSLSGESFGIDKLVKIDQILNPLKANMKKGKDKEGLIKRILDDTDLVLNMGLQLYRHFTSDKNKIKDDEKRKFFNKINKFKEPMVSKKKPGNARREAGSGLDMDIYLFVSSKSNLESSDGNLVENIFMDLLPRKADVDSVEDIRSKDLDMSDINQGRDNVLKIPLKIPEEDDMREAADLGEDKGNFESFKVAFGEIKDKTRTPDEWVNLYYFGYEMFGGPRFDAKFKDVYFKLEQDGKYYLSTQGNLLVDSL